MEKPTEANNGWHWEIPDLQVPQAGPRVGPSDDEALQLLLNSRQAPPDVEQATTEGSTQA